MNDVDGSGSFIFDNNTGSTLVLDYVTARCAQAAQLDIATGFFEIGALLALQDAWKEIPKIRILIGGDTSRTTVRAVRAALDGSFDDERLKHDPFLEGVEGVIEAISSEQIEIKVYAQRKFHAKTYITHGNNSSEDSAALVGSSNFTRPGLSQNIELNVHLNDGPQPPGTVSELKDWFERHWAEAEPARESLLSVITAQTRPLTPLEVYGRALQVLTRDVEPSEAWEENESAIFPVLAPYQKEAYRGLRQMGKQWRGGFLTDGVGLGKTFVGLMLAEYFAVKERRNVLVFATKTGKEAVWEPEISRRLPNLIGPFSRVMVKAHTDLSTRDAPTMVEQLSERADVVIIDEAHHFRNRRGKGDEEEGVMPSRWWQMQEICRGKQVFLLTATPINNSLTDLLHQAEMFTGLDNGFFASVGIGNVQDYLASLQKEFRLQHEEADRTGFDVDLTEFEELLKQDHFLESVIYQNSRKYAVESSKKIGEEVLFPVMEPPRAVNYSFIDEYKELLKELDAAFKKDEPLFALPMYYPLAFSLEDEIDTKLENRQKQVVALIRTVFLKRFESSLAAFAGSCLDLTTKVVNWLALNTAERPDDAQALSDWQEATGDLRESVHELFRPEGEIDEDEIFDDLTPEEFDELEDFLEPEKFDLSTVIKKAFEDLSQLGRFLERITSIGLEADDKYQQLLKLLHAGGDTKEGFVKEFRNQKVLVFTEFSDTAQYLHKRLVEDGLDDVQWLDGSRKADRMSIIKRFAPHYNRVEIEERELFTDPFRVLVSTDVLSEGVNLQDASLVINYDLHWNPVRLMQRIGRVDRRLDADTENAIIHETPSTMATRGKILVRNFLPHEEVDRLLRLYDRVEARVVLISKTLGIPGGKLLTQDDMLDDTKVFQAFRDEYEGQLSPLEQLRLKYLTLIEENPHLEDLLKDLPKGTGTAQLSDNQAVFSCRVFPSLIKGNEEEPDQWTLDVPKPRWELHRDKEDPVTDLLAIDEAIAADSKTKTAPFSDRAQLRQKLDRLNRDALGEYRKDVLLPLDAPDPQLVCWMELHP